MDLCHPAERRTKTATHCIGTLDLDGNRPGRPRTHLRRTLGVLGSETRRNLVGMGGMEKKPASHSRESNMMPKPYPRGSRGKELHERIYNRCIMRWSRMEKRNGNNVPGNFLPQRFQVDVHGAQGFEKRKHRIMQGHTRDTRSFRRSKDELPVLVQHEGCICALHEGRTQNMNARTQPILFST